jgi:hypothetical protein
MPRLYGAPSYGRPPRHVEVQRPFDPDDLPLESHRRHADHARLGETAAIQVEDQADEIEQSSFLSRAVLPFGFRSNRPAGTRR